MDRKKLGGVFTALVTPFNRGEICWTSLKRLLRAQLDGGVDGIVVCGTTGESPTLNALEKKQLFDFIRVEVSGSATLVMGTGGNSTAETVAATRAAKEWGAAAALVVVPYYNKPSQRGLYEHFKATATEGGLPVILYNVPSRTITKLELSTIQDLAKVPGIVAIKEASGDIEFGRSISSKTDLLVSSGDDGTYLKLVSAGARGVISVISNVVPKETKALLNRAVKGDAMADKEFAMRYGDLNNALYWEANPIPVKYVLYMMGLIESAEMRLPLTALDEKHREKMQTVMKGAGLL